MEAVYGGKSEAITVCRCGCAEHSPKHRAIGSLRRTQSPNCNSSDTHALPSYLLSFPGAAWREAESGGVSHLAIVQMGYAEHEKEIFSFKTFEYNLICFDELTSFTDTDV